MCHRLAPFDHAVPLNTLCGFRVVDLSVSQAQRLFQAELDAGKPPCATCDAREAASRLGVRFHSCHLCRGEGTVRRPSSRGFPFVRHVQDEQGAFVEDRVRCPTCRGDSILAVVMRDGAYVELPAGEVAA